MSPWTLYKGLTWRELGTSSYFKTAAQLGLRLGSAALIWLGPDNLAQVTLAAPLDSVWSLCSTRVRPKSAIVTTSELIIVPLFLKSGRKPARNRGTTRHLAVYLVGASVFWSRLLRRDCLDTSDSLQGIDQTQAGGLYRGRPPPAQSFTFSSSSTSLERSPPIHIHFRFTFPSPTLHFLLLPFTTIILQTTQPGVPPPVHSLTKNQTALHSLVSRASVPGPHSYLHWLDL